MSKIQFMTPICLVASFLMALSCTQEFPDSHGYDINDNDTPLVKSPLTAEDLVYDEATSTWYIHRQDPYSLDNFQQAYDNLLSNTTLMNTLDIDAATLPSTLNPTHYCLKIYPQTEDEQWEIELMDDVDVLYTPFDYVALPDESDIDTSINYLPGHTFFEISPYTVTYESITTEGDSLSEIVTMPILYTVWPITKALPTQYQYEIIRTAFIPRQNDAGTMSVNAAGTNSNVTVFDDVFLALLEQEAIELAIPAEKTNKARKAVAVGPPIGNIYHTYHGRFVNVIANQEAPLSNLRVRLVLGSRVENLYTDNNGVVQFITNINSSANVQCYFLDKYWKICHNKKTNPVTHTLGTLANVFKRDNPLTIGPVRIPAQKDDYPYYQIQRAANYYYYGGYIGYAVVDKKLRIIAQSTIKKPSYFHYSPFTQPYITIYNRHNDITLIGTVLHELGHLYHFALMPGKYLPGAFTEFRKLPHLIKESYASYFGWYVGKQYLLSIGAYIGDQGEQTGNDNQYWKKTDKSNIGWYSPLFVDLFDDFNQNYGNKGGVTENISSFSHSVIYDIAKNCRTWSSVRNKLKQQIGVYYTESEFNAYIAPYDYYFSH